jgi:hypothetical protein
MVVHALMPMAIAATMSAERTGFFRMLSTPSFT